MTIWDFWNRQRYVPSKRKPRTNRTPSASSLFRTGHPPTSARGSGLTQQSFYGFEPLEDRHLMAANIGATFEVTNVNDSGVGSLRWAIDQANNNGNGAEYLDVIEFNIGTDPGQLYTITVNSTLTITEQLWIKGFSQGNAAANTLSQGNDAGYRIELHAGPSLSTTAGTGLLRLNAGASGSIIEGLTINSLTGGQDAIVMSQVTGATIRGNYFGLEATGENPTGMGRYGITISLTSSGNTIGGDLPADANVFGGSFGTTGGAHLYIEGTENVVAGNLIGTNATGTVSATSGNTIYGVLLVAIDGTSANSNTIGGTHEGARNVLSGNTWDGISVSTGVSGVGASNNLIAGNYIGTDVTGTQTLGNGRNGITSLASNNTVGGTTDGARNVISGNNSYGVYLINRSRQNEILGNYIGTDKAGTNGLGVQQAGIVLLATNTSASNSISGNTIGGTTEDARNIISGNSSVGISIGGNTSGNVIASNYIGTDRSGTQKINGVVSNAGVMISVSTGSAVENIVGGAGMGNVISGHNSYGVYLAGASQGNLIAGNLIGTNESGDGAIGNYSGVYINGSAATGNTIGGNNSGEGNIISGNRDGIYFNGTTGNLAAGNTVGLNLSGSLALGNTRGGVVLNGASFDNTIGGPNAAYRNVISGNTTFGLYLVNGSSSNLIAANFIGTNANGTVGIGSQRYGLLITSTAAPSVGVVGNTIGGVAEGYRNVISGNSDAGVSLGINAAQNLIAGNFIGTDKDGAISIANGTGVRINGTSAADNTVGGSSSLGYGNLISGNTARALLIDGPVERTLIAGNTIGANAHADAVLGNGVNQNAIVINNDAAVANTIGGASADFGNYIVGATGFDKAGVYINGSRNHVQSNTLGILPNGEPGSNSLGVLIAGGSGNTILSNSMANNSVGIQVRSGSNVDIAAPMVRSAFVVNDDLYITLETASTWNYDADSNPLNGIDGITLQFFFGKDGQGRTFLGDEIETSNGIRVYKISGVASQISQDDGLVTTVTDAQGNTSAFSAPITIGIPPDLPTDLVNVFVVTNTYGGNNSGDVNYVGSLHWAIEQANTNAGYDLILFDISAMNPTIDLTTTLTITDRVFLDGYSQAGGALNTLANGSTNAVMGVQLQYSSATGNTSLLVLSNSVGNSTTSSHSVIRGIAFNRDGTSGSTLGAAIAIDGSSDNTISGNYFNLGHQGDTAQNTRTNSILIASNSSGNVIGGGTAQQMNVFAGNFQTSTSAHLIMMGSYNIVAGNLIGTERTGTQSATSGTTIYGIRIVGDLAVDNTIGGTQAGARNIISGNTYDGINVSSSAVTGASGTAILGNFIGTDVAGTVGLGNGRMGVALLAARTTVGGTADGSRNIISGNGTAGIYIINRTTGSAVLGNYIGSDVNGTVGLGTQQNGIIVLATNADAANRVMANTIGGTTEAARNVISGNSAAGVSIGGNTSANLIAGNYLGTDRDGASSIANGTGIRINGTSAYDHTIGGSSTLGYGNLISGNNARAILIDGPVERTVIAGNTIGANANAAELLGNGIEQNAIAINNANAKDNTIGGASEDFGNYIVGATGVDKAGVYINGSRNHVQNNTLGILPNGEPGSNSLGILIAGGSGNAILSNSMANNSVGIQLRSGSNANIAAPAVQSAVVNHNDLYITLEASAAWNYDADGNPASGIEGVTLQFFFGNDGQGRTFLGQEIATADGVHNYIVSGVASLWSQGDQLVTTVTDANGNTSAFSTAVEVNHTPVINNPTPTLAITDDDSIHPFGSLSIEEPDSESVTVFVFQTQLGDIYGELDIGVSGFSWAWDPASEQYGYLFVGTADAATTAIQQVVFIPARNHSSAGDITSTLITIEVRDAFGLSTTSDVEIEVTSANDAPSIEGVPSSPIIIDATTSTAPFASVTINDPDLDHQQQLTVTIEFDSANGTLSGAEFPLNPSTGRYEFNGPPGQATLAIRSLTFSPTQRQVPPGEVVTTIFTISVHDGIDTVVNTLTTVKAKSINTAPSIEQITVGPQTILDYQAVFPFASVLISDPDLEDVTVRVTLSDPSNGRLVGHHFAETDAGSGIYVFNGSAAAAQTSLRAMIFLPTADQVPAGGKVTTTLRLEVSDQEQSVADDATTVMAISFNNAPQLENVPLGPISYLSTNQWTPLFQGLTPKVTDSDAVPWNGGRLVIERVGAGNFRDQLVLKLAGTSLSLVHHSLYHGNTIIGTQVSNGRSGAPLKIEFTQAMTNELLSELLANVGYVNTTERFSMDDRTRQLLITVFDGGGTDFGATNRSSTLLTINLPLPLIQLPDGPLTDLNLITRGGAGLSNSVLSISDYRRTDPVGALPVAQTNVLTTFGTFLNEVDPMADSGKIPGPRFERFYTNGWSILDSFQMATQSLLPAELFRGVSPNDASRQMIADRITRLVAEGILDGSQDGEIVQRIMNDFQNVHRRLKLGFTLEQSAIEKLVEEARRLLQEQSHPNTQTEQPKHRGGVLTKTSTNEWSPGGTTFSVPTEKSSQSLFPSLTPGWLYEEQEAETVVDSLFSSDLEEELCLAGYSPDITMHELAASSIEDGFDGTSRPDISNFSIGLVGLSIVAHPPETRAPAWSTTKSIRLFPFLCRLLGLHSRTPTKDLWTQH